MIKKCVGPCGRELEESKDNFYWRNDNQNFRNECIQCCKIRVKNNTDNNKEQVNEYRKKYRENNKENRKEYDKWRYENNKNYFKSRSEEHYENNKEYIKAKTKKWRQNNRKRINENHRSRIANDPEFKLRSNLSGAINYGLKRCNLTKQFTCMKYVNYNIEKLKKHLESLFYDDMNWNNYGKIWQIDHKVPQTFFDFSNIEEIKICWSLSNLQPLYSKDNLSKQAKINCDYVLELYNEIKNIDNDELETLKYRLLNELQRFA